MAVVFSKYSTHSGYEANNCVEVRGVIKGGLTGYVESDIGGAIFATNGIGSDVLVLHISEAVRLRNEGLADF
ncbi:hypothetical protein FNL56_21515 [Tardiphaga sp. vice304]|uniref:hypothetical protein n=1 Tax=Tardiphaga sp. vice304 TaxID=2592817 RepID=UPI0011628F92|nr:hypothetical protein [Tardiphaga sp. vice304]QDM28402.1 hypothetical protein FNL56_21515 [Tardiphaga sp. vice304]